MRTAIPPDLDFGAAPSLSAEVREKLTRIRPLSIGQAGRIQGVTPAALTVLMTWLKGKKKMRLRSLGEIH